jgi:hypothetical protein
MTKVSENPYRKALANIYIEKYLERPEGDAIKRAVNGNEEDDRSLDFYIGAEKMIGHAIDVFMRLDQKSLHGAGGAFSMMLYYVSYEIERLSAFQNER